MAAMLLSGVAQANEALAQKNNCLGCHAVAQKLVGPAYKDVAAKYAGQADAQALMVESIRNGSVGKWGDLPMPAHPKLSDADLKKLASWVLSAK
jgi:cytochrome c